MEVVGRGMKVGERAFSGGASFSFVSPRPKASGPPTFLESQTFLRFDRLYTSYYFVWCDGNIFLQEGIQAGDEAVGKKDPLGCLEETC